MEREQEHLNDSRYMRYHKDVYLPRNIIEAALEFLPDTGVGLGRSRHYDFVMTERGLPSVVNMPEEYEIIDVTVIRDTFAVFRVCIRFPWPGKMSDFVTVLEGDYEMVSSYWNAKRDRHRTLDEVQYEQSP
ncbi:hypothetical protein LCGC14_0410020 [marine sediment metagenome]|uniref:Uncharacterized protein n=1 Tax=marine sediment metagenome TaxID=412755 RepID=A0A0F9W370_9ZZZZ